MPPYAPAPAIYQGTSDSPTGTVSTTSVMLGLGASITPQATGRIFYCVSGSMGNDTTGDGVGITLYYGTGTAPGNGAALTGTAIGTILVFTALTGMLRSPFSAQAIITGLAVPAITSAGRTGTAVPVWLDLAIKAVTGGTADVTLLNVSAFEF